MTDRTVVESVASYLPGLFAIVLTAGVSLADNTPVPRPGLFQTVVLTFPVVLSVATTFAWSHRRPSPHRLFALAVLSWGVFSLTSGFLLDPAATQVVGSLPALLDLLLVWVGSYAVSGAVVYGVDWPAVDAPAETDVDRPEPGRADD